MSKIIEIIKGFFIGVANIIPGVSGGTLAVVMGIYDKLINAVSNFFKHPIATIKEIWVYIVGVALGVGSSVIGVSYLLEVSPVPTTALFVGLIIGAIPVILNEVHDKKVNVADIVCFCIMMVVVILLPVIGAGGVAQVASETNPLLMALIGVVAAATMVVPGVSGSMVLMAIGYYESIADLASSTIKAALTLDFSTFFTNFIVLLPFAIGVLVGIIIIAKIIKWLFEKYNKTVHWAILGLVVASPFAVIMNLNLKLADLKTLAISAVTFAIGVIIANKLSKIKE